MIIKTIKKWADNRKRAETLLEVMVALVVMTIGSVSATTLILAAINANIYNKDALMALNLAQEGIEYMRNLRDTNWIRFSANRQGCWNIRPELTNCSDPNRIAPADVQITSNQGYALGDVLGQMESIKLNLNDGISPAEEVYRLKYWDLDADVDSDNNNLDINGDGNWKNDDRDYLGTFYTGAGATFVENTKFYRSINIVYKTINPVTWAQSPWPNGPVVAGQPDLMQVYSTVQWMDGAVMHQIQLTSALSQYKK